MKNIILVTGPFAGGKTKLIAYMMADFLERGILFASSIISDSQFLTDVIHQDHREYGGIHHVHEVDARPQKHEYQPDTEHLTFISASPYMQSEMFRRFFLELSQPRDSGQYVFAELAAGVNRSPAGTPAALNDYSYWNIIESLRKGLFDQTWIERVAAVIHVRSSYELRRDLNEGRRQIEFHKGDDVTGAKSRPLPESVMQFTKEDDFYYFRTHLHYVHNLGSIIVSVENDGTQNFFERGRLAILERINHSGQPEGQRRGKEF